MGSSAQSYMRKGFLICEELRKLFPIYEEAVSRRYGWPLQASSPPYPPPPQPLQQGRTPDRVGTLAPHWVKCVCWGRAWSTCIGLNLISYTVKKNPPVGRRTKSRLTEKRLIFRPTDSLVLRLPLWLMEFLMRSTSFFTVYSNPGLGHGHPNKGGLRT
jgi:hypothetical protein